MEKDILNLEIEVKSMLAAFRLNYKRAGMLQESALCFLVVEFGVIVCVVSKGDYSIVKRNVERLYKDWRYIFITTEDNISEKRNETLWQLMRAGYMSFIRTNYNRQFINLLTNGLGHKIINKRLELWGDRPKYKWLIEENKMAKKEATSYILSQNPAFFDYMPSEEVPHV